MAPTTDDSGERLGNVQSTLRRSKLAVRLGSFTPGLDPVVLREFANEDAFNKFLDVCGLDSPSSVSGQDLFGVWNLYDWILIMLWDEGVRTFLIEVEFFRNLLEEFGFDLVSMLYCRIQKLSEKDSLPYLILTDEEEVHSRSLVLLTLTSNWVSAEGNLRSLGEYIHNTVKAATQESRN